MTVRNGKIKGIVCGRRSNGERCVLWSDSTIGDDGFEWMSGAEFDRRFVFLV